MRKFRIITEIHKLGFITLIQSILFDHIVVDYVSFFVYIFLRKAPLNEGKQVENCFSYELRMLLIYF